MNLSILFLRIQFEKQVTAIAPNLESYTIIFNTNKSLTITSKLAYAKDTRNTKQQ